MIIGTFTYDREADRYHGQIQTLSLSRDAVEFRPQTRSNDREPDYRIVLASPEGDVELGAAWRRRSDRQQDYLSVLLDDPVLEKSVSAALFTDRDGKANLVWTRQAGRTQEAAPAASSRRPRGSRSKPGLREPATA